MWYAGLDWADTKHDIVVIDEAGHQMASKQVSHTKAGLETMITFLTSITGIQNKDQLACIIETNRGLLIAASLEAGLPLYPVHPKTVDRRRGAAGSKTDQIDAYLLAKLGRAELADLRKLQPDSLTIAELKALTRDQESLIQMQTRLVNQLTACLKAYYPVALKLFTKLQQRSTLVFLQAYPTPQTAQTATVEQLTQTLKQGKHSNPHAVAPKVFEQLHQPQLTADVVTTRTKARLMQAIIQLLQESCSFDGSYKNLFLGLMRFRSFLSCLPSALLVSSPQPG